MTNLSRYQDARGAISDSLEKTLFTARMIGVLSVTVSEKDWNAAIGLATPPAAAFEKAIALARQEESLDATGK